jgi:type I site-specific restriction endonuclease
MYKNVAKSIVWPHTDIFITTPQTLYKILSEKANNNEKISPEMIVVDDADLIINKKEDLLNYFNKNYKFIQKLSAKEGSVRHILATPFDSFLSSPASIYQWKHVTPTDYANSNLILSKLKISTLKIEN